MWRMSFECKRCGRCCYFEDSLRPCPFLLKLSNGLYACRVYTTRFASMKRRGFVCRLRKDSPLDYVDCPYNTDKPIKVTH